MQNLMSKFWLYFHLIWFEIVGTLFKKPFIYRYWQISYSFDLLVLLTLTPSSYKLLVFYLEIRMHWGSSIILKTSKKVYEVMFFFLYINVCLFWKCIQYTIHWDKTKILKKSLHTRLEVQDHHGFTFNLQFLKKSISVEL